MKIRALDISLNRYASEIRRQIMRYTGVIVASLMLAAFTTARAQDVEVGVRRTSERAGGLLWQGYP